MSENHIKLIIDTISTMTPTDALSVLVAATVSLIVGVWEKQEDQDRVAKKVGDLMVSQIEAARWLQSQSELPN